MPSGTPAGTFFQLEPAWSPDGKRIAFASRRDGRSHIYVMEADGTGTKKLTSGKHTDETPSWSPDGRSIVFSRDTTLFMMTPTGGDLRRVTSALGGEEREPAWSPDGKWIAFVRRQPGFTTREIWRMRPDGTGRRAADAPRRRELRAVLVGRRKAHRLLEQRERQPVPDLRDRRRRQGLEAADVPARRVLRSRRGRWTGRR